MPLPTVLMTDVVRSSSQGDSHGGAYLIDLETKSFEQVLDWNRVDINWEGRGQGRGLRGICFVGDEIYIAASDELFVFDQQFNILRSFKCDYLHHCHEIAFDGDQYIYLSATSYDSVLRFDIQTQEFDQGWWMRTVEREYDGKVVKALDAIIYNPNEPNGAQEGDTLHINNVCVSDKTPLFSGLSMNLLVVIENGQTKPLALVPPTTHNCQPLGKGVVYNSTGQDSVIMADRQARIIKQFSYPKYDESSLTNTDIPGDYARQGFGRGLCIDHENRLVIAGSSPGTVSAFDVQSEEMVASVQVSNDLRNAPHGLEIWPF
jgi:glucose/arabinose dehydrogenase